MLKIGVIGTGSMGKNHARICSDIENVELAGIADIDENTAKKLAKKYSTEAFSDYKEIIPKIDAAIVATPTKTHYKIAMELLENGKHVLVEKPLCKTVKDAFDLTKKSEKEGLVLATGHIERHNPVVKFVKDSLTNKKFGQLITLTSKRVSNFPGRIRDVGVIFDFGIHDIDVMRYLAGDVKSVYAKAGRFNKKIEHEDYGTIVLTFENGVCGIVEVNWLTPVKIRKLNLTCSEKFVEADYINQSATISTSSVNEVDEGNLFHIPIQHNTNYIALQKREPLRNEIEDFIQAIQNNTKPLATGEDGLNAIKIAEAATVSYKHAEEVKIL